MKNPKIGTLAVLLCTSIWNGSCPTGGCQENKFVGGYSVLIRREPGYYPPEPPQAGLQVTSLGLCKTGRKNTLCYLYGPVWLESSFVGMFCLHHVRLSVLGEE